MIRSLSVALLITMSCVFGSAKAQEAAVPLRIGTLRIASQTDVAVAQKYGFFAKNKIEPQITLFNNGAEGVNALQGGSIDVLLAIFGSGLTAASRGFDLVPIFQDEISQLTPPDTSGIHVMSRSPINTIKDLEGKKLAVGGLNTQNTVAVQTLLKRAGVNLASVNMIEMPFPAMYAGLSNGVVDAVNAVDPFTTQIRMSGQTRTIAYNYIETIPEQPLGVWFARKSTSARKAELLLRFNASIKEAVDFLKADPSRARQEIVEWTKLDPAIVAQMPLTNWSYEVRPAKWQLVIDMLYDFGSLTEKVKADDYIAPFLQSYVKK